MSSALVVISLFCITVTIYLLSRIRQNRGKPRLMPYVKSKKNRKGSGYNSEPLHLYVTFCNHLSPFHGNVSQEIAEHRVVTWQREYTNFAFTHKDSFGNHPVHTFFYDEADYNPRFIDVLYKMCKSGIADVEILLRREQETASNFRRKVESFRDVLFHHHGLLRRNSETISFAFVNGYTALREFHTQNLQADTKHKPLILKECGCYADFTSVNSSDTARYPFTNSINISAIKSNYQKREDVKNRLQNELLYIEGPAGINWKNRRYCIFPRTENGEISARGRFTPHRARLWLDSAPQANGDTKNIFLKLHTYGAVDSTVRYMFGESGLHELYGYLERLSANNGELILHYVSAYDMYRKIHAVSLSNHVFQD